MFAHPYSHDPPSSGHLFFCHLRGNPPHLFCHLRSTPDIHASLSSSGLTHTLTPPVIFGLDPHTHSPLSSSGLTRRSRERKVLIILRVPTFWIMRCAYPLTAFGAACRRCLRPPLPRDCANKKLPVASFYASPFTLLKTRTILCPPFEI